MIVAELFTQGPRVSAMSISVLINWASNFAVGYVFPIMQVKTKRHATSRCNDRNPFFSYDHPRGKMNVVFMHHETRKYDFLVTYQEGEFFFYFQPSLINHIDLKKNIIAFSRKLAHNSIQYKSFTLYYTGKIYECCVHVTMPTETPF